MTIGKAVKNRDEDELRAFGMSYPHVTEHFPWGHRTLKVAGKSFIFMGTDERGFSLSVKLPASNGMALMMSFASPTGYGMAKSGWVTAAFKPREKPPLQLLKQWMDESYRAVAPKRVLEELDGAAPSEAAPRSKRKTTARKSARTARK